jgi:rhodanese-related sulfurtransferase
MYQSISAEALMEQILAGSAPTIVDVRSKREYESGHLPGALHLPFWLAGRRWRAIATLRESPVVLYCGHGPRAHIAGANLARHGFARLSYLSGHMKRWKELNFPLEGA